MFFSLAVLTSTWAAPSVDALSAAWADCTSASAPPNATLTQKDLEDIAEGELIKGMERIDAGGAYIMAAAWVDVPREAVWIALLDRQHFPLVAGLRQTPMAQPRADEMLYQQLDVPWPVTDRQWVIDVWNVADGASGDIWVRRWSTGSPDLITSPDPEADWVEVNEGIWQLVEVDGGTFMVFSTRTVLGGMLPEEATMRWALLTIDNLVEEVSSAAANMGEHYTHHHAPIARPGGGAIPPMSASN